MLRERVVGHVRERQRGEILDRLVGDAFEDVEPIHFAQAIVEIAEHERNEILGLLLPALRRVAREDRVDRKHARQANQHEAGRERDHRAPAPSTALAVAQVVEIDADQSRDELRARIRLAVLARPRIGRDRLETLAGFAAIGVEAFRQRRGQAFVVLASGPCARAGLAVDDQAEDAIAPTEALERRHLLVDPARLRRVRRADHDQIRRLHERVADFCRKVRRAR